MKALKLLKEKLRLQNQYKGVSGMKPFIKETEEAIEELEELIAKDKSKNCEECYNKTKLAFKTLNEDQEALKKENTRLKKQLSKGHHMECSCSFCKPVACSYVVNNNSSEMW